jgi:glucosamine kinase
MTDLVVGADIGGTSTRVAVADSTGQVLAMATGGPGNPNSVGVEGSAAQIRTVIGQALDQVDGRVLAVVIGLAGGSRAAAVPGFLRAAVPDRVDALAQLVGDPTVAFCSATPQRRGYVLVAGTGAIAAEVVGDDLVQQRDGWGWLLGDEGSGFWMGRAAVRSTLAALQRSGPLGPLHEAVLDTSGAQDYLELLQACYSASPTWLAQFSSLVSAHAADDPVAAGIARQAVAFLEELFLSLEPEPMVPVVLGGSVLTKPGPVSAGLRARLASRSGVEVLTSSTGVIGALWIALRRHVAESTEVHQRLVSTAGHWP